MKIKVLTGSADRIMILFLPFAVVGIVTNLMLPGAFRMGFGFTGGAIGIAALVLGVPMWITSAVQVLVMVPKGRLITSGPYALLLHPLYTSVALLVIPGIGLLLDTWLGFLLGALLYLSSRIYAAQEEEMLAKLFGAEYAAYRKRVLLPWL